VFPLSLSFSNVLARVSNNASNEMKRELEDATARTASDGHCGTTTAGGRR